MIAYAVCDYFGVLVTFKRYHIVQLVLTCMPVRPAVKPKCLWGTGAVCMRRRSEGVTLVRD